MKRQHGRTGPRVVSAWTALWVGLLACFVVGLAVFLAVDSQRPRFVTEQNVVGSSEVLCPDQDEVEIYSRVSPDKQSEQTSAFMRACQYQFTGTPFIPAR